MEELYGDDATESICASDLTQFFVAPLVPEVAFALNANISGHDAISLSVDESSAVSSDIMDTHHELFRATVVIAFNFIEECEDISEDMDEYRHIQVLPSFPSRNSTTSSMRLRRPTVSQLYSIAVSTSAMIDVSEQFLSRLVFCECLHSPSFRDDTVLLCRRVGGSHTLSVVASICASFFFLIPAGFSRPLFSDLLVDLV